MTQLPFEWHQQTAANEIEVVLEPRTIDAVITLMAQALNVVVRAAHAEQGADDDQ